MSKHRLVPHLRSHGGLLTVIINAFRLKRRWHKMSLAISTRLGIAESPARSEEFELSNLAQELV